MTSVMIVYRRRWFLERLPDGDALRVDENAKIEVPVAVCWTEKEVRALDETARRQGFELCWEEIPVHELGCEVSKPPDKLYVRFHYFSFDKDSAEFWQLVDPIGVEGFLDRSQVDAAIAQSALEEGGIAGWNWEYVLEFNVPWRSKFLDRNFSVKWYPYSDKPVELTT